MEEMKEDSTSSKATLPSSAAAAAACRLARAAARGAALAEIPLIGKIGQFQAQRQNNDPSPKLSV